MLETLVTASSLALAAQSVSDRPQVHVDLRYENGVWSATFDLPDTHDAYMFGRRTASPRGETMEPSTGVQIERAGARDVLVIDPTAEQIVLTFEPDIETAQGEIAPALQFSNGDIALFAGQFELLPVESLEAARAMDGDIARWQGVQPNFTVSFTADTAFATGEGPGEPGEAAALLKNDYVFVGEAPLVAGQSFTGVIDPGLPDWISGSIDAALLDVFAAMDERWGFSLQDKPMVMFAFGGLEGPGFQNNGGAIPGSLTLLTSGEALAAHHPVVEEALIWFFAHEAVHLYQAKGGAPRVNTEANWIHEGGANAIASGYLVRKGSLAYVECAHETGFEACVSALEGGSLDTAWTRGARRAVDYECGEILHLAIEEAGIAPEALWLSVKQAASARAQENGGALFIDNPLIFSTLREAGLDDELVAHIERIVTEPLGDPRGALERLTPGE